MTENNNNKKYVDENKKQNNISKKDREILRKLATKVAELAARPGESEKKNLWYAHNALKSTRPLIFCDPENGWKEIITKDSMKCEGELAQNWEFTLKKEIFWGESMGDDRVVSASFNIHPVYYDTGWGVKFERIGGKNGGSFVWDACLKDYSEMDKLHFPQITVDHEATEELLNLAKNVFNGLLEVKLKSIWWWSLGMTDTLIYMRGFEQVMIDMYDYPEELHRLMAFLRDGYISKLDYLEKKGLLSLNNDNDYVGSGGFGFTHELPQKDFEGRVRASDMWGFMESQETTSVSPAMFEDFIFQYQLPIMERFGINCYGCCEPLDKRWHVVNKIPRLRRVSVSPWSNLGFMAEALEDKYIYSMKPNPADLAVPQIDEEYIRKNLREAMRLIRNCRVEIIMKDNHTIGKNPQNVVRWCRIVREEAESL